MNEKGMKNFVFATLVSVLFANTGLAATYVWTDDNGQKVYSQTPPPDGRPSNTINTRSPSRVETQKSQLQLDVMKQKLEKNRNARLEKQKKNQAAAEKKKHSQEQCNKARANIQRIQQRSNALARNSDGSYTRMTEQDKAAKLKELETIRDKHCK